MRFVYPPLFLYWPALLAGVMATLAGVGLARFAYTPLIPVVIQAQWFSASEAAYLGAANLLGYFVGAMSAHRLASSLAPRRVVAGSLVIVVLSFALCSFDADFYWFFSWRFLAGVAGAVLMVVVPSMALSSTPVSHRAVVGTLVFTGVGLGAVLSAFIVPRLLEFHLTLTWLVLAGLSLVVGVLCDQGFKRLPRESLSPSPGAGLGAGLGAGVRLVAAPSVLTAVVLAVMGAYALDAAGFLPHTIFWVDYLARQQGFGQSAASLQWALFGLGALCGPLLVGVLVHQVGWHRALCLAFGVKALAVLLPVLSLAFWSQSWSSFLVGVLSPGITALVAGRLLQIVGVAAHQRVWGLTTALFAATQALSGYGMSAFYAATLTYAPLYGFGSLCLALGCVLVVWSQVLQARRESR